MTPEKIILELVDCILFNRKPSKELLENAVEFMKHLQNNQKDSKNLPDNEIIKEIQDIKESMKRHIDLTNEMGQELLRIDEEYTGGSKVWLTTDFFKKVVKHFCHSNYLVKCLELVFDYINRLQAVNEKLSKVRCHFPNDNYCKVVEVNEENEILKEENKSLRFELNIAKAETYKELLNLLESRLVGKTKITAFGYEIAIIEIKNLLKEKVGADNG